MKAEMVDISGLHEDPANVRRHSDRNLDAIRASLARFGQQKPVVVGRDNIVVAGNGTLRAAKSLGWNQIAVVRTDLEGADAVAFAIADNRTAELAEWDEAELAEMLRQLDDLDGTGFTQEELSALERDGAAPLEGDEPQSPADDPVCRMGDVWALGDHRVLVADSSGQDAHAWLSGCPRDLVVLDPPYQLPDSTWTLWISDPSIVFGQMRHMRLIPDELWRFERVIVKRYRHRSATVQIDHRHAFVAQVGSEKCLPGTTETFPSVLEQEEDVEHSHQKPVSLIVEHMTKWTPEWSTVIDPFLGSGSTLIAAEQLGRRCFGIEIDQGTVDAVIQRWERATGKQAVLDGTNETFVEVGAKRKVEQG